MHQLPKLYLLLSSVLMFTSCSISKYSCLRCDQTGMREQKITPVLKPNTASKFKASIDILKNHLTGLIIVKQTDSVTTHIVFVTELGMKMFDFEINNKEIKAVYVFEPLNKPKLVNVLKQNFNNMLLLNVDASTSLYECRNRNFEKIGTLKKEKNKWYYSGLKNNTNELNLSLQETFHNRKRTSKINYTYNSTTQSYSQIKCKQYGLIKFYFELNEIQPTND